MEDLTGFGKVVDSKLAERAYEDVASEPGKEVGEFIGDAFKAFRHALSVTCIDPFKAINLCPRAASNCPKKPSPVTLAKKRPLNRADVGFPLTSESPQLPRFKDAGSCPESRSVVAFLLLPHKRRHNNRFDSPTGPALD